MSIINLDVLYGISNRFSVDLTVPFLVGGGSVMQGPAGSQTLHEFDAKGLGDVSFQAEYWLSDPGIPSRISGSVSLGFLAPTGNDQVRGTVGTANGDVRAPIDEAYQLGSGGWQMLFRAQGTAQLGGPLFAYGSGYYGLSLNEHTDVLQGTVFRGVPDTYSGRLGAAYLLPFRITGPARDDAFAMDEALVFSLGGRINGVTVKDLVGGGDLYFRRPGYAIYVEPGLTWTLGPNTASVSVPVRAYANRLPSLLNLSTNPPTPAAGSFAPFLFLASFGRRF